MIDTAQQGQHGEPWELGNYIDERIIFGREKKPLLRIPRRAPITPKDETDEVITLEHVVACVNGCAGKKPEAYGEVLASLKELRLAYTTILDAIGAYEIKQKPYGLAGALERALKGMRQVGLRNKFVELADAAIAKAEGEEPTHE